MGKLLINDFHNQRKNIVLILMITVIGALVGIAFQAVYYCIGILLCAGFCFIYFISFFDPQLTETCFTAEDKLDEDRRRTQVLRKKMYVKTKYIEIIFLAGILYILMSVAFIIDAIDHNYFIDPDYNIIDNLETVALFPLTLMFITSIVTPVLFKKRLNKSGFVSLALFSIILPYSVFLFEFFTNFTEIKLLMVSLPFPIIGIVVITYFTSLYLVTKQRS